MFGDAPSVELIDAASRLLAVGVEGFALDGDGGRCFGGDEVVAVDAEEASARCIEVLSDFWLHVAVGFSDLFEAFDFFFEFGAVHAGYVGMEDEADAVVVEPLELFFIHCRERYAAVLNLTLAKFAHRRREITEVALEAAQHIVHAAYSPPLDERQREVVVSQADERKELLVKLIVARLAYATTDGGADTQTLLQVVVAIIERHKTVGSYAAIDVHDYAVLGVKSHHWNASSSYFSRPRLYISSPRLMNFLNTRQFFLLMA